MPLRLLFISNLYPPVAIGGYENLCLETVRGLQARGHEVFVLTSSFRASQVDPPEEGVYRLLRLRSSWKLTKGPTPGVGRHRLEVDWHNAQTTRDMIRRLAPDSVVFFNGGNMGRAVVCVAERAAPVVYRLADPWLIPAVSKIGRTVRATLGRNLYSAALRRVGIPLGRVEPNHLIFASESLRAQYRAMGIDVSRSKILYPGVSAELFPFRPPHIIQRRESEPSSVLYVGRICPEKGVTTLIHAISKLRATLGLEQTRLTMLGVVEGARYARELRDLIKQLGLRDAIEMAPFRPRSEVSAVYGEHDILVFPSEWNEPFGLTLIEAMASGIPVIASLAGGPREIVRDGQNAVAFRAGDAEDLAKKAAWALAHPSEAAMIGRVASRSVHERFSFSRYLDAFEGYLEGVCSTGALVPA